MPNPSKIAGVPAGLTEEPLDARSRSWVEQDPAHRVATGSSAGVQGVPPGVIEERYQGVSNPPDDGDVSSVDPPYDERNAIQREFDTLTTVTPEQDKATPPILRPITHFGAGAIQGVGQPFVHPLDTLEGGVNAFLHPITTAQQTYQGAKEDPAKLLGTLAGGAVLGGVGAEGGSSLLSRIPTRAKAGNLFSSVMEKAADQPVQLTSSSQPLLRVRELADRGASMPQAANKLLRRVTDPEQGPLTYSEARDFASNLSRLSSGEAQKLTPVMKRQVGELSHTFNQDVGEAAQRAGVGEDYTKAMHDYALASRLRNAAITGAKIAVPTAIGAAGYGLARKLAPIVLPR